MKSRSQVSISRLAALALAAGLSFILGLSGSGLSIVGAASDPITIGVVHDLTGFLTQQGTEINAGIRLHMDEIGYKVAGREIKLLFEDSETKVDAGLTKARKLVEKDRVNLLIGPVNSGLAYALRDYVDSRKIPMVITQATAKDLTQSKASPYIFRTSFGSEQYNLPIGWYAYAKLGYRKAVVVALDNVPGHEQMDGFLRIFKQMGGQVVAEIYPPLGTLDMAPYLAKVKTEAEKADFVFLIMWGPDAIRFIKGYSEYGLKGKVPIVALGSAVDEALLPSEGDAALGILNYMTYTPSRDTPENRRFTRLLKERLGKEPTSYYELGYITAKAVSLALQEVKGNIEDTPGFLAALRTVRFESPQGLFRFDDKQNAIVDVHIRRVEKVDGKLMNVYKEQISGVHQFWTPPR